MSGKGKRRSARLLKLEEQKNDDGTTDSLRRFVRHAGMKARVAAEFKILECDARARQNPVPPYWNGLAPSAGAGTSSFLPHSGYYPPPPSPPSAAATPAFEAPPPSGGRAVANVGEQAPPWCKLETDELLKLLVLMGKPVFLERAKQMFGDTRGEESSREGHATRADNDAMVGATAAAPGEKSGASEQAFGPFAPPKLVPGRLGFGQFAGSSAQPFKVKPSTSKASGKKKALE